MNSILKKILVICSMFIFTQNLIANEQIELKNYFLDKIDKVIIIIQNKELSIADKNDVIIDLLTSTFDFELMTKLALGKKTWKSLKKEKRAKFIELYIRKMATSYSSKLDTYNNEIIEIKEIHQPKPNRISLVTNFENNDEKLKIVYKFYKPKKQKENKHSWLIYDVEILGVSILKADKAQFREFLQTKSIDELMKILSK